MPSSFSKTFTDKNTMRYKDTDGLRALTYRDFGTKLKFHELRAFAILMAMTEPTAPKVEDADPNTFVLTTKKGNQAIVVRYDATNGQPTVEFIYDHLASRLFARVRRYFGSSLLEPMASASDIVNFPAEDGQDCA